MVYERRRLLLVNSCINRTSSRTLSLARRVASHYPNHDIDEIVLEEMNLRPLDSNTVNLRNRLSETGNFDDKIFDLAHRFADADIVIIATPYWEDCFSSMTKIFMEYAGAVGVAFRYSEKGAPIGLCKAERLYYVTTRGGYISDDEDLGYAVYRRLCDTYGIRNCRIVSASGLDIFGNDPEKIMAEALDRADAAVREP